MDNSAHFAATREAAMKRELSALKRELRGVHSRVGKRASAGDSIRKTFTQVAHGFAAQNSVYFGGTWVKVPVAASQLHFVGVVESVSGDDFTVVFAGLITFASAGLTANSFYYQSTVTAGALVGSVGVPTTDTARANFTLPVMVALTTATAVVYQNGVQALAKIVAYGTSNAQHLKAFSNGTAGIRIQSSENSTALIDISKDLAITITLASGQSIKFATADFPAGFAGGDVKLRELDVCDAGVAKKILALCSAAY